MEHPENEGDCREAKGCDEYTQEGRDSTLLAGGMSETGLGLNPCKATWHQTVFRGLALRARQTKEAASSAAEARTIAEWAKNSTILR